MPSTADMYAEYVTTMQSAYGATVNIDLAAYQREMMERVTRTVSASDELTYVELATPRSWSTSTINELRGYDDPSMEMSREEIQAQRFRDAKRQEAGHIKELLNRGYASNLRMTVDEDGRLGVYGKNLYGTQKIFVIDHAHGTMRANKKRTSHIKALLTGLAEREGLQFELLAGGDPEHGDGTQVAYWPFNIGEVDDAALLTANIRNPHFPMPEPEQDVDDDYGYDYDEDVPF